MIDRLERDPETPPSDALAECIVLRGLLYKPELLSKYDPTLLLVFPEHRAIHACMRKSYALTQGQPWGEFCVQWIVECEQARPGLCRVLDGIDDDQSRLTDGNPWGRRDWLWWWQRLRDLAEARRLVSVAQSMAATAWQGDVEGARQIAARATPRRVPAGPAVWERDAL